MRQDQRTALACGAAALVAAAGGFACYQLAKMLFAVLNQSYEEAQKAMLAVAARIINDSPDEDIPEELVLVDDTAGIYAYGHVQDLYYRRSIGGETDWEWSYDGNEWFSTADLAADQTLFLDPPSLFFILRLHLISVARRKAAAVGGAAGPSAAGQGTQGPSQAVARIPPPVPLPSWAEQQLAAQHAAGGRNWQGARCQGRQLSDAPDALCCPITGQIMLQPVCLPSGKTFECEAVRRWITQHGTDPTTLAPLSLQQLYPNLLVREMVEHWLNTGDALGEAADSSDGVQPGGFVAAHLRQHLQQHDSEDPLSSFNGSSSSSSGSSSNDREDLRL